MNIVTRLEYMTEAGKKVSLAASHDPQLARLVAHRILWELNELSETDFEDEILNVLAEQECAKIGEIFSVLGLQAKK